jgi:enoyl-CoA hydratase
MAVGNCKLPTIAAVNGAAVGAGLNLALAADVRIAGPAALFDARFQQLGLHPGGGATWMLQRAVGPQVARAALLFGMRFDAESAVGHGLALSVADDPVAAALELAAGPAAAPREVVLATKATMRATASPASSDNEHHALAMHAELGPQATSIQSPAFAARLAAARRS